MVGAERRARLEAWLSNMIPAKMPTTCRDRLLSLSSRAEAAVLADHLHRCIEEERAALAGEVHDEIGGALAALRFDLAWIGRHASEESVRARAAAATETLLGAIEAGQRIAHDLLPPMLDQGLAVAVRRLAADFQQRTGITTRVTTTAARFEPVPAVQRVAYRTAQEALTNVGKHAQCSEVSIELRTGADLLTLAIADNGQGLARAALEDPAALGLKGLRRRARTVNGRLRVGARPGVGTSVTLRVPLQQAEALPDATERRA